MIACAAEVGARHRRVVAGEDVPFSVTERRGAAVGQPVDLPAEGAYAGDEFDRTAAFPAAAVHKGRKVVQQPRVPAVRPVRVVAVIGIAVFHIQTQRFAALPVVSEDCDKLGKGRLLFLEHEPFYRIKRVGHVGRAADVGRAHDIRRSEVIIGARRFDAAVLEQTDHRGGRNRAACLPHAVGAYICLLHAAAVQRLHRVAQSVEEGGIERFGRVVCGHVVPGQAERLIEDLQGVEGHIGEIGLARDLYLPAAVVGEAAGFRGGVADVLQGPQDQFLVINGHDAAAVPHDAGDFLL